MSNQELHKIFTEWWIQLQENNGGRAQLRRCSSPEEAVLQPETHRLKNRLPQWIPFEAVSTLAGVAAHIRNNNQMDFGQALATPKEKNGRSPLSENRFRQLLSCQDWNELYRGLLRAVTILDGNLKLTSIFDIVLLWNEEFRGSYRKPGKSIKYELSREYYTEAIKHENK